VALNLSVRSDCVGKRYNAPRTRSRTRVCKNQKISLHFSRVSSPHPSTAKRKRNGKEIFGFASPSTSPIHIINHDGIFHNRLYHASISMASKYRLKYQKLIERLRQARLEASLTQVESGKRLKKPQAYISKIERGERRIDAVELDELAKLYGKPLDYFVK